MQDFKLAIGSSMLPFLRPTDQVLLQPTEIKSLKKGDLLVYSLKDTGRILVLHRVVSKSKGNDFVLAKGDNVLCLCEKVYPRQIKGRVVLLKRGKRTLDLRLFSHRALSCFIAFLSRHNLTPDLVKRRYFDSLILSLAGRLKFIYRIRELSYPKISHYLFSLGDYGPAEKAWRVKALLYKRTCASADIINTEADNKTVSVITNLCARQLDRNDIVIGGLCKKACQFSLENHSQQAYFFLDTAFLGYLGFYKEDGFEQTELPDWAYGRFIFGDKPVVFKKELAR